MKSLLYPALVAGLMSAAPAFALTLDFEGIDSYSSVADYYAGQGVEFGGDALAFTYDESGPFFSNNPSGTSVMSAVFDDAAMNVANGFVGSVSFYYSSVEDTAIGVYSGLNGTGTLLGTIDLAANATNGCSDTGFCNWTLATLNFAGTAQSVGFGSTANIAAFDNVSISPVPEPSQAIMLALGLSVIGLRMGRRKSVK